MTSNLSQNVDGLDPCSLEKADTRILLYVKSALNHKRHMISTFDTGIVVLAVAKFQKLDSFWDWKGV